MVRLAVDQSTAEASAAVFDSGRLLAECAWRNGRTQAESLLTVLPGLLQRAGVAAEELEVFVVGLGPGLFSALRTAVSAVCGLALPSRRPVCGLCSARAIACEQQGAAQGRPVVVVGDARRARLWLARFAEPARSDAPVRFELLPSERLASAVEGAAWIVSPDWESLAGVLAANLPPDCGLATQPCRPQARVLGELAEGYLGDRVAAAPNSRATPGAEGLGSEPDSGTAREGLFLCPYPGIRPFYLHPPVAPKE